MTSPNGGLQGVGLAALGDPFAGVALLEFSLPVRAQGVVVERSVDGTWEPVDVDLAPIFGADAAPLPATSTRLLVRSPQAADGEPPLPLVWRLGERYRVRLTSALTDLLDRPFDPAAQNPAAGATPVDIAVEFVLPEQLDDPLSFRAEVLRPVAFDTRRAAAEDLDGAMPGGVNTLYQGLWTDPVTGLSYARARWLDTETGSFLSEDPLGDVDSPNLYAFVANSPFNLNDPRGQDACPECYGDASRFNPKSTPTAEAVSREVGALLVEFTPGGMLGDASAVWSGHDVMRQEDVGGLDRVLTTTGVIPGVSGGVVRRTKNGIVGLTKATWRGLVAAANGLQTAGARATSWFRQSLRRTDRAPSSLASDLGPGEFQQVNEAMSDRAATYQSQVTGRLPDVGYVVDGVKFDGYDVDLRTLQEAKGPGYATFTVGGTFREWYRGADALLAQARRQIAAAPDTRIRWEIAEQAAFEAIENLFLENEISAIDLVLTPPQ